MNNIEAYLKIGGCLHFGVLIASSLTPGALDWRKNLATLHPFLRKLFWVYGGFIVLVIISFGLLTLRYSHDLASGEPFARGVCFFIAVFWLARLFVQLFIFDAKPFLTNWFYKLGYNALTLVFIYFLVVYGMAAFH